MRRAVAIAAGVIVWSAAGALGLALLRVAWPDYARAVPTKGYSTAMLLARLGVSVLASVVAGAVAGRLDAVRAAWGAGAVLVSVGAWIHLGLVWADYPAWYHAAFLLPLAPLIAAAAWRSRRA